MRTLWKIVLLLPFISCQSPSNTDLGNGEIAPQFTEISPATPAGDAGEMAVDATELVGIYAGSCWSEGDWGSDRVRFLVWGIDSVVETKIVGKAVMDGEIVPWQGSAIRNGKYWSVIAGSSDDGKWAGSWLVEIEDGVKMSGSLAPRNLQNASRRFSLKRRAVVSGPGLELPIHSAALPKLDEEDDPEGSVTSAVSTFNASKMRLTASDLQELGYYDLKAIRYAIFARRGQIIPEPRMRLYFEGYVDWYLPYAEYSEVGLTQIERENIELLKRFEEYAEIYFPAFGR